MAHYDSEYNYTATKQKKHGALVPLLIILLLLAVLVFRQHPKESLPELIAPTPSPTASPTPLPPIRGGHELDYGFDGLSLEGQVLYELLTTELSEGKLFFSVTAPSLDLLNEAFAAVLNDHPEIFWVESYSWSYYDYEDHVDAELTITPRLAMAEVARLREEIAAAAEDIIFPLRGQTDYEKVKGIYEYLIHNTEYDLSCTDQSLIQVLLEGRGVCAGYARSMQYLLRELGVETLYVGNDEHAWNIVRIDGEYYHVDATQGDPVTEDGSQTCSYAFLCLSTNDIMGTTDHQLENLNINIPLCAATEYNYFIHEGLYFTEYDAEKMDELVRRSARDGSYHLEIRTANESTLTLLKSRYGDPSVINTLYTGEGVYNLSGLRYAANEELCTLTLDAEFEG